MLKRFMEIFRRLFSINGIGALMLVAFATPVSAGDLVDRLIEYHGRECSEQKPEVWDLREERSLPEPSVVTMSDDAYFRIQTSDEQGYAEVLIIESRCGDGLGGYCGSAGCLGYIVFEDRLIFEFMGGRPFSVVLNGNEHGGTLIMFPRSPMSCQYTVAPDGRHGESELNDPGCFSVGHWSGSRLSWGPFADLRRVHVP